MDIADISRLALAIYLSVIVCALVWYAHWLYSLVCRWWKGE